MFGKRFAFQFEAAEGEPWTGMRGRRHGRHNWRGHHWPGPRFFGWHMRRAFFKRGGPFGAEGFFGFPGRGKRFFGRGDLKYALLELLQERSMHGYEMMKALQERTRGMYTASAGSVYPTLQMLEDRGFVTASAVDGKKVYSITEAGHEFLAEGRPEERGHPGRHGFWHAPHEEWADVSALWQELHEIRPLAGRALHNARSDPEQLRRLRKLLEQVRVELAEIAGEADKWDA